LSYKAASDGKKTALAEMYPEQVTFELMMTGEHVTLYALLLTDRTAHREVGIVKSMSTGYM